MIKWSDEKTKAFQKALLTWYDTNKRDLPWRKDHEPYHIWVSEIMLQQTQVNTVIPYYERFMRLFPSVNALANAPESQLLKAWEGLGYYSRVRNMQRAAQQLVQDYAGRWPHSKAELQELVGIGPYTAGAIASIAFQQPEPAVDGNAFRVFSQLLEIDADITKPQTRALFEKVIRQIIPIDRPGDFNQAIMDLGASYMTPKNSDNAHSPVRAFNQAYLDDRLNEFPVRSKRQKPVDKHYFALVIRTPAGFLFQQRASNALLAKLWMFPLIDIDSLQEANPDLDESGLLQMAGKQFFEDTELQIELQYLDVPAVSHTFTHQKWHLTLVSADLKSKPDLSHFSGKVVSEDEFEQLALPTVQKKLWAAFQTRQIKLF
ncbi:A/G-specific adenine glycosylase [Pediococcus cellicola]|uniref:Adenine DNA glycosylase n=1 Tax=Pediococcus cellicola TaxID=319652 RepID=A0A0R2IML5_9LACO|nr:A/G-specific adenine glycosylase [Pediococcus cellicola]KRN66239.1 A G-specific adenine glycosylase [Pediococcus cellicola]GEL15192.1 A/G-specific adenine glycosylase [Pediococcus cellicola]